MTASSKLQRWTDLLAALLIRRYPASFDELARDIPAYSSGAKSNSALMRMFERDKDELRSFGVPIETVISDEGETVGYKLSGKDFYLPYLSLVENGRAASKPRKVAKYGYQSLTTLAFEPDELAAIASAVRRVSELGDAALKLDAESATRKLAFDLPVGAVTANDGTKLVTPRAQPDADVLAALNDALLRRKRVTFQYRSIEADADTKRSVEPYGLFFVSSHWYLAGRDVDTNELRNFRVSRISDAVVNPARAQSRDYEIPSEFRLRDHARSRQAWELGEGDLTEAIVRLTHVTGANSAAAKLGEPIPRKPSHRRFRIRREDAFARWLLPFGGEAIPLSPPSLVSEFVALVEETWAIYDPTIYD